VRLQVRVSISNCWFVECDIDTTKEFLCKNAVPGDVQSYIWIVNTKVDGTVSISVQGETSFPKLDGKWSVDRKTLIVEGVVDRVFGNGLFWFKLALDDSGVKLQGIRRLVSDNQSSTRSGGPCFSDFEVTAKRQCRLAKGASVAKSSSSVKRHRQIASNKNTSVVV